MSCAQAVATTITQAAKCGHEALPHVIFPVEVASATKTTFANGISLQELFLFPHQAKCGKSVDVPVNVESQVVVDSMNARELGIKPKCVRATSHVQLQPRHDRPNHREHR